MKQVKVIMCSGMLAEAAFKDDDGRNVRMEFHSYCGPMFSHDEFDDGGFIPAEDSVLWDQFEGWYAAFKKRKEDHRECCH